MPDPDREGWASQPAVLAFIQRVLDHRDLRGRFPKTFTYRATDPELRVLDSYLPEEALRTKSHDRSPTALRLTPHSKPSVSRDSESVAWWAVLRSLPPLWQRLGAYPHSNGSSLARRTNSLSRSHSFLPRGFSARAVVHVHVI